MVRPLGASIVCITKLNFLLKGIAIVTVDDILTHNTQITGPTYHL